MVIDVALTSLTAADILSVKRYYSTTNVTVEPPIINGPLMKDIPVHFQAPSEDTPIIIIIKKNFFISKLSSLHSTQCIY